MDTKAVETLVEGSITVTHVKTYRGKTHLAFGGITVEEVRALCRSVGLSLARPIRDTKRWIQNNSLQAKNLGLTEKHSIIVIAWQLEQSLIKILDLWVSNLRAIVAARSKAAIAAV